MTVCKSVADNYDACKWFAGILWERCIGVERWGWVRVLSVRGGGLWREGVIHSWWMTHSYNNTSEIESAGVVSVYEKLSQLRNEIRNNSWNVCSTDDEWVEICLKISMDITNMLERFHRNDLYGSIILFTFHTLFLLL